VCALGGGAVVDGVEFDDQIQLLASQAGRLSPEIAVMLGTNRNEGTTFTHIQKENATQAQYLAYIQKQFSSTPALAAEIAAEYRPADFQRSTYADGSWWAASAIAGDFAMSCAARRSARYLTLAGAHVWLYFFDEKLLLVRPSRQTCLLGISHHSHMCDLMPWTLCHGHLPRARSSPSAQGVGWGGVRWCGVGPSSSRHPLCLCL